jgi:formate/nitrite transporter FocA (FNT family)
MARGGLDSTGPRVRRRLEWEGELLVTTTPSPVPGQPSPPSPRPRPPGDGAPARSGPDVEAAVEAGVEDAETSRLSAAEIFDRVTRGAEEELARPISNLAISAMAAGLTMGLSAIGVALLRSAVGSDRPALASLGYPLGFVAVILGRQQLFTENTLFPVALLLDRRRMLGRTAVLWAVVLGGNVVGALAFALLSVRTPALPPRVRDELVELGRHAAANGHSRVFWSAVIAGWVIALVAWLVTASTDTMAQVVVVLVLTYVVGLGEFAHSVAGTTETLSALVHGDLGGGRFLWWFGGAVSGNAVGGVVIVALLNYGQVRGDQRRASSR